APATPTDDHASPPARRKEDRSRGDRRKDQFGTGSTSKNGEAHMSRTRTSRGHGALVAVAATLAAAGAFAAYAMASAPNQGNRLEATYTTSIVVLNNQLATYGIVQAIATGS